MLSPPAHNMSRRVNPLHSCLREPRMRNMAGGFLCKLTEEIDRGSYLGGQAYLTLRLSEMARRNVKRWSASGLRKPFCGPIGLAGHSSFSSAFFTRSSRCFGAGGVGSCRVTWIVT